MNQSLERPVLFIGIDWATDGHEVYTIRADGPSEAETLPQRPEAIEAWLSAKQRDAGGGTIAIALEQGQGGLVHALMFRENVRLYIINPRQFHAYRTSFAHAGCKNDQADAHLIAQMLYERWETLKVWVPDDEITRSLSRYCRLRRRLVDERTRLVQQLLEAIKSYFPAILDLFSANMTSPVVLALLKRWPDPRRLKRADRRVLHRVLKELGYRNNERRDELIEQIRSMTLLSRDPALLEPMADYTKMLAKQIEELQKNIRQFEDKINKLMSKHKDAELFRQLPGAGAALAPRLLVAFGSQRDRYESAEQLMTITGIAPVIKQSGKSKVVHRRYARPVFLHQTFIEFAEQARRWCPWSRAYYCWLKDRGMGHNAILRKLASRWIRILYRCWKTSTPYSPEHYIRQLYAKNREIIPYLDRVIQPDVAV